MLCVSGLSLSLSLSLSLMVTHGLCSVCQVTLVLLCGSLLCSILVSLVLSLSRSLSLSLSLALSLSRTLALSFSLSPSRQGAALAVRETKLKVFSLTVSGMQNKI